MSDPATLATGLANALGTISLRTESYLADTYSVPCALIGVDRVNPHLAYARQSLTTFTVFLILARTADRAAIARMESYMAPAGTGSITAALESDQSLGGVAATCKVVEAGPPAAIAINGNPYISCPFTVEIVSGD